MIGYGILVDIKFEGGERNERIHEFEVQTFMNQKTSRDSRHVSSKFKSSNVPAFSRLKQ